ncbi:MAG: SIS domain-containing protein [Tannerella sp.]|nr:SIS domain-containing protein [Tannerella sp.]
MNINIQQEFEMLFEHYPALEVCRASIWTSFRLLSDCYHRKGLIMACGNGGSAADAEHLTGELMKGFKMRRPLSNDRQTRIRTLFPEEGDFLTQNLQQAIPAISLVSQTSLSTAFINDVHADMVFAQQVWGYGKTGDVLIGFSTSGNSRSVVNACKIAKASGLRTIGFTGEKPSRLLELCDVTIQVPAHEVYRIQELHLPVYHTLCAMLEIEAFGQQ